MALPLQMAEAQALRALPCIDRGEATLPATSTATFPLRLSALVALAPKPVATIARANVRQLPWINQAPQWIAR